MSSQKCVTSIFCDYLSVPVVSSQQIDLKKKTTYEREYSDTGGDLLHNVQDLGRIRGSRVVQNYLAKATPSGMIPNITPYPPTAEFG